MRIGFAVVAAMCLTCGAASRGAAPATAAASRARIPYTARFKSTTLSPDGSILSSSATVRAVDSTGRRYVAYSENNGPTAVQVFDPVSLTMSYWAAPGTKASLVHMPDLGEPESDCAKKMKAITPLHPAGVSAQPEDLGRKTFLGVEANGGKISFVRGISRAGSGAPSMQTNEVWTAANPRLDGLIVHMVMITDRGKTTEEMVEFKAGEPDPKLFQMPLGREITRREGQAYSCGSAPAPVPSTPAK